MATARAFALCALILLPHGAALAGTSDGGGMSYEYPATFIGSAFTLRPRTIGITTTYPW